MSKKIVSILFVAAILAMPNHTNQMIITSQAAEQSSLKESRDVDLNTQLNLPIGGSYIYEFAAGSDSDVYHDTFEVIFKNTSGKYKFIVMLDSSHWKNWVYESPELTKDFGYGFTFVGGLSEEDIIKIIVLNTGYTTFTGNLRIPPSYYMETIA